MKTPRLLALLAAALFCAASPQSSPAADMVVDISSFAPREPEFILRQIELNVAIKQYEKVLMELPEAKTELTMGPTETGLTDEQEKQWRGRAENKLRYLEETALNLHARISKLVNEANEMARQLEKDRAREKAKPKAEPCPPKVEPRG
jgi:hypothetical protein